MSGPVFNKTNENISYAAWSWNPYSGCLNDCPYCYARDIANRFYEEKFQPTFRPERLTAPSNTKIPKNRINEPGIRNVFVCSMGDLFGQWVAKRHIDRIIDVVRDSPQWTYLFLTKNPDRLLDIDWPANAWVGTTVDVQDRVERAVEVFLRLEATVKFLSCEPLLERIEFETYYDTKPIWAPLGNALEVFDWVIIGGRSKTTHVSAMQPEWEWVESLLEQSRDAGCKVYFKPNLVVRPKEYPECLNLKGTDTSCESQMQMDLSFNGTGSVKQM